MFGPEVRWFGPYQPVIDVHLDDVQYLGHNEWAGELLAVREFSDANKLRKIGRTNFLPETRLFKNATWTTHFHSLHVLDHASRVVPDKYEPAALGNAHLGLRTAG